MADKTVFAQLFQLIPAYEFNICVEKYNVNKGVRSFSCWDQYLAMAFALLTRRSGLRDIEACLNSHKHKLDQMGFCGRVSRSTPSEANSRRDYKIFQDSSLYLINRTKSLLLTTSHSPQLLLQRFINNAGKLDSSLSGLSSI